MTDTKPTPAEYLRVWIIIILAIAIITVGSLALVTSGFQKWSNEELMVGDAEGTWVIHQWPHNKTCHRVFFFVKPAGHHWHDLAAIDCPDDSP